MNAIEIKLSRRNRALVEEILSSGEDKEIAVRRLPKFLQEAVEQSIEYSYYCEPRPEDFYCDALEALLL